MGLAYCRHVFDHTGHVTSRTGHLTGRTGQGTGETWYGTGTGGTDGAGGRLSPPRAPPAPPTFTLTGRRQATINSRPDIRAVEPGSQKKFVYAEVAGPLLRFSFPDSFIVF